MLFSIFWPRLVYCIECYGGTYGDPRPPIDSARRGSGRRIPQSILSGVLRIETDGEHPQSISPFHSTPRIPVNSAPIDKYINIEAVGFASFTLVVRKMEIHDVAAIAATVLFSANRMAGLSFAYYLFFGAVAQCDSSF